MILTKKGNIVTMDSEDHPPNSEHNKPASSRLDQRPPSRALHTTTPEAIRVCLQCNQMLPAFRCVSSEVPVWLRERLAAVCWEGADDEAYLLVAILMAPVTAAGTHAAIMATLMPFMSKAVIRWSAVRTMTANARALMTIWVTPSRIMRRESFT